MADTEPTQDENQAEMPDSDADCLALFRASALYTPFDRQRQFHEAPAKYRLFGGAAGPGKTKALLWEAIIQAHEHPGVPASPIRKGRNTGIGRITLKREPGFWMKNSPKIKAIWTGSVPRGSSPRTITIVSSSCSSLITSKL